MKQIRTILISIIVFLLCLFLTGLIIKLLNYKEELKEIKNYNKACNNYLKSLKEYKDLNEIPKTGILFDLSQNKNEYYILKGSTIKYNGNKIDSGKIFIDGDGEIKVVENFNIGHFTCVYKKTGFNCMKKIINKKTYKEDYKIGSLVKYNNDEYRVATTNPYTKFIRLFKNTHVDINKDGKIDEKDKIAFDNLGRSTYIEDDKNNIGFYITNEYLNSFKNKKEILDIGLLKDEDYIFLRSKSGFPAEWYKGNFLASDNISSWWIIGEKSEAKLVKNTGSFNNVSPKEKHFLRPTIVIKKTDLN